MNEIIQITQTQINGSEINSVNAKELHLALGLKNKFGNWIKKQKEILEDYEEGVDYIRTTKDSGNLEVIVKDGLNLQGKECEYILCLDMAKHISLMSKSAKGKEVRKYFIDAEKQSKQIMSPTQIMESLQLAVQGITLTNDKIDLHHIRINKVENYIDEDLRTRSINFSQQKQLQDIKNKRVYELGGEDKALISKLHSRIWSKFKKHFELPRYSELPAVKFTAGCDYLRNITISDIV